MSYYSAEVPTTLELFHYRMDDLLSALQGGPGSLSRSAFSISDIHRGTAFYQMEMGTFEQSNYDFEFGTDDGAHILIRAVAYRPVSVIVTTYYDPGNERGVLFTASFADWLEQKFHATPETKRPELTEAQDWLIYCRQREEAKQYHDISYAETDRRSGRSERTAREWCKKFREQGRLW